MTRSSAILALAGLIGGLGAAASAEAADRALFMAPATTQQVIGALAPATDSRSGPAAPAVLGLGQPQLGVRPEVLAYTGASTGGVVRLRLSDAFYRPGLVITPGPGAAQFAGAPGLVDLVALQTFTGAPARACAFACIDAAGFGQWLEQAPRPRL